MVNPTRFDQGQTAVQNARKLLRGWQGQARMLTRNKKIKVELSSQPSRTDGKTLWIRVPPELAELGEHEVSKCDKRDHDGIMICKACMVLEDVNTTVLHEMAHIIFESFEKVSDYEKRVLLKRAASSYNGDESSPRIQRLKSKIEAADIDSMSNYYDLGDAISKWMPLLMNAGDDIRVNSSMQEQRPGTRVMFNAQVARTWRDGVQNQNGEFTFWKDTPVNAQALIGVYCKAGGFTMSGISEEVADRLDDPALNELCEKIGKAKSVSQVYEHTIPLLGELRRLGFFVDPEEEDEDESDSGDEDAIQSGGDDADDGEGVSGESDSSSDSDDSSSESSDSEDSRSEVSDDGVDDEGSGDDDSSSAEMESSDDTGNNEPGGSDPQGDNEEESVGDGDAQEDSNSGSDDGSSDSEVDSDSTSNETETSTGSDPGDSSSSGGTGDSVPSSDRPDEESVSGEGGTEPDLDGSTDDGSDGEQSSEDGTSDAGEDADVDQGQTDSSSPQNVDKETLDNQGDVDEVGELFATFGGHEEEGTASPSSKFEHSDLTEPIRIALDQIDYFDSPSLNIGGVNVAKYDDDHVMWRTSKYDTGYKYEEIPVSEAILMGSIQRLRMAFTENKRAKMERNLRSGKVNPRVLARRAPNNDDRLFHKKKVPGKRDWFVVIGIDISGSTSAGMDSDRYKSRISLIKATAKAKAEMLSRLGIRFALFAHSGGLEQLEIFEIKAGNEPWGKKQLEALEALRPYSGNLDGHTLEYYRKAAQRERATDKLILYYTDGAMPASNYNEELEILQREIETCKKLDIKLVGMGCETSSPEDHGLETIRLDSVEDIPVAVKALAKKLA